MQASGGRPSRPHASGLVCGEAPRIVGPSIGFSQPLAGKRPNAG